MAVLGRGRTLDFDFVAGSRATPVAALPSSCSPPFPRHTRCGRRDDLVPASNEDEQDEQEELLTPGSGKHLKSFCTSSPGSSSGTPWMRSPGSAGSGASCSGRPSLSEMSEVGRMTPEALAERGAGFPWMREPGLCRVSLGSGQQGMDAEEMERARNFCILSTPELASASDATPPEQSSGGAQAVASSHLSVVAPVRDALEEDSISPTALQRSFEEHVLRAARESPTRLQLASMPPVPASLPPVLEPTHQPASPPMPRAPPPNRPPQKRLRLAPALRGRGGA